LNNHELRTDPMSTQPEKQGLTVDYKRVLYHAVRYWYVVVLSFLLAVTLAFLTNRYAQRVYSVSASILIKETKQTSGPELLYSNQLTEAYRNYFNEIYIIRSYPLIQSVLEQLNFGSTFYMEGNILTRETYDFPAKGHILNTDAVKSCQFNYMVLNDHQFELSQPGEKQSKPVKFSFNDTISFGNVKMVFLLTDKAGLDFYYNRPLIYSYVAPEYLAGEYVAKLNASWAEEGSGVMNLSVNGMNPNKEKDFMHGLIRQYQSYDLRNKNEIGTRTIDFINDQLKDITDSLRHVENLLESFKGKNIITDASSETSRLYKMMEDVELQRTEMIIRQNYYQYLMDYIQKDQNLDQVILPSSVGLSDGVLASFITEMSKLQLDLKAVIGGGERLDNPLIRQKRERLQEIKQNIIESVKNQQQTDKIRQSSLTSRIASMEKQISHLPEAERQYVSINRNYSLLENLYIFLLQKRAEVSISQASNITDIEIVNPPMAGGPISPNVKRNYILAGFAGLALPILIFVFIELLNTRVQSKEDIEKITSIPFIGGVGHKQSGDNKTVMESPKSAVAESFRALRSNLTYFLKEKDKAVILITSSISGEGKTFTTINLATVLAFSGKKTLIVGADLRRPKLFDDFGLTNAKGLSSYLVKLNDFQQVVQHTGLENLDLISGGPVPPNPSELILSERMNEFMREARLQYDYIIIDSPPLAIVADAFVLADHADHMLYLVRQNYSPKSILRSLEDYYQSGRLKNISVVLNDIYRSGPGYGYGYGYTYGYGYGYGYGRKKNGHGYYAEG
jgi:capsular exopolysaccharide synthesis family protein